MAVTGSSKNLHRPLTKSHAALRRVSMSAEGRGRRERVSDVGKQGEASDHLTDGGDEIFTRSFQVPADVLLRVILKGLLVCACAKTQVSTTEEKGSCAAKTPGSLTSELHVGNNDLLADARERVLGLKQLLVVGPLADRRQELDGVANQLKQANGWSLSTDGRHAHTRQQRIRFSPSHT